MQNVCVCVPLRVITSSSGALCTKIELQALSTRSKAPARVWAIGPGNSPVNISTHQEHDETSPWKSQNMEGTWGIMENIGKSHSMRLDLRSRCEKPAWCQASLPSAPPSCRSRHYKSHQAKPSYKNGRCWPTPVSAWTVQVFPHLHSAILSFTPPPLES